MIRTYLEFAVAPGRAADLVAFFEREQILATSLAQEGCHSAELTVSDDGLQAIVTASWTDREAYQRWTSRTDRGSQGEELSGFLSQSVSERTVGRVFDVAATG